MVDQEPEPAASGCCIQPVAPLELRPADEELARLAKALGHPVRVAIVRHLLQLGERVCTDLSDVVPLAHSTAIQHINVLREAGLLCASRSGRNVYYCVNPAALRQIKALIAGL
ncbi:MAG: helix-turn-helix transcriptional regulator [Chloroflexi bacterium]|nr:helix-turn-helix transcriptional regulator [Chloroflexota bacterium]